MIPCSVANLLMQSSDSPFSLMNPHSARVVCVGSIFPASSTSHILNCTEAWSCALMSLLVAAHFLGTYKSTSLPSLFSMLYEYSLVWYGIVVLVNFYYFQVTGARA